MPNYREERKITQRDIVKIYSYGLVNIKLGIFHDNDWFNLKHFVTYFSFKLYTRF